MKKLLLLLFAVPLLAQQPLPQRDSLTIDDLKVQIADCHINANTEAKFEAKLVARIRELEKEVEDLKNPKPVAQKPK